MIYDACQIIRKEKLMARIDLTGKRFNKLVVLSYAGKDKQRCRIWKCKCDCGNIKNIRSSHLLDHTTKSCGCSSRKLFTQTILKKRDKKQDLTGKVFGYLTVLDRDDSKTTREHWRCRCVCGNITTPERKRLIAGTTRSCGCLVTKLENYGDLSGKKFGRLTVIKLAGTKNNESVWQCLCSCGTIRYIRRASLTGGRTNSCGCIRNKVRHGRRIDKEKLIGKIFGRWTVIKYADKQNKRVSKWTCQCSCGTIRDVRVSALVHGDSQSCGCQRRENVCEITSKNRSVWKHELTGKIFTYWTVLKRSFLSNKKSWYWSCQCKCGVIRDVDASNLVFGRSKSCGCLQNDQIQQRGVGQRPPIRPGTHAQRHILNSYMSSCKKVAREFSLSPEEFYALIAENCYYCELPPSMHRKEKFNKPDLWYNGIDRVNPNEGYHLDNVVTSCKACNWAKQRMSLDQFYSWLERMYTTAVSKGVYKKGIIYNLESKRADLVANE
jgi:hypothetical protein